MSFQSKKSYFSLFLSLVLTILFINGCGSSRDSGALYGEQPQSLNTGNLLVRFSQIDVYQQGDFAPVIPTATTVLEFVFYNGPDYGLESYVFHTFSDPTDEVLIQGVPVSAEYVLVSAYDEDGVALGVVERPVEIVANGTTELVIDTFDDEWGQPPLLGAPIDDIPEDAVLESVAIAPGPLAMFGDSPSISLKTYASFKVGDQIRKIVVDDVEYELDEDIQKGIGIDDSGRAYFIEHGHIGWVTVEYTYNGVTKSGAILAYSIGLFPVIP